MLLLPAVQLGKKRGSTFSAVIPPPHRLTNGKGRPHLIELSILSGCEAEALLPALKGHQVGQEAICDVNIIAKVALHLACHCS